MLHLHSPAPLLRDILSLYFFFAVRFLGMSHNDAVEVERDLDDAGSSTSHVTFRPPYSPYDLPDDFVPLYAGRTPNSLIVSLICDALPTRRRTLTDHVYPADSWQQQLQLIRIIAEIASVQLRIGA